VRLLYPDKTTMKGVVFQMKASKYNFFFPYGTDEDKVIAYNSFSNSLALLDKDKHEIFTKFCEGNGNINDKVFVNQLKSGRFLIDANDNELDLLKFRMLKGRYNTDQLSLTISPTADCNFRCTYCYEKDAIKPEYMTTDVEDAIIKLVEGRAPNISNLAVVWYGGEPLMNIKSLERLSRKFIEICEKNNVLYMASMITNGSLLTRKNAALLKELRVTYMQITVDGTEDIHNKRRPFTDGSGSFNTIIDNMAESKDLLPKIGLRINVDRDNVSSADKVFEILKERDLLGITDPHLGKLGNFNNNYEGSNCFNNCDFSNEAYNYFSKTSDESGSVTASYPTLFSNVCTADSVCSCIINADGKMYRCMTDIGNTDKCIGHLSGDEDNSNVLLDYMLNDPTEDPVCSKCNILPICMGGCPNDESKKSGDKCSLYKYTLDKYLNVISSKMAAQKAAGA